MSDTLQDTTPAPDAVEEVAAKAADTPIGYLDFAALKRKPRRSVELEVTTTDEHGDTMVGKMKFLGLSPKEFDDLVASCPPSAREKALGAQYDVDTFTPALIAKVSYQPKLTVEQVKELIDSGAWTSGEVMSLFLYAQRVCQSGIDVPFNDRG